MEADLAEEIREVKKKILQVEGKILQVEEGHQDRALLLPLQQKEAALQQEKLALLQKEVELAKQKTLQMQGAVPPLRNLSLHGAGC